MSLLTWFRLHVSIVEYYIGLGIIVLALGGMIYEITKWYWVK